MYKKHAKKIVKASVSHLVFNTASLERCVKNPLNRVSLGQFFM